MYLRRALVLAVALFSLLVTGSAWGWQEAHEIGDDVHIRVESSGAAVVQHEVRWHVVHGPLRSIDLVNVDPAAVVEPNVTVRTEDGRELAAHAARHDDKTLRITIDEPRQLMRGNFTFQVRWRVDLVSSHALARTGGAWRVVWSMPVATDGFDAVHAVLDLPSAPDEPRAIVADTGAVDDGAVATFRRETERDILELVRPHVARGESVTWTVRVDPRAFQLARDPRLRAPLETTAAREPDRVREASLGAALLGLALAFALLVAHKTRSFGAACAARGAAGRALLPLPESVRAVLAGGALAGAVWLEILGEPTTGAVLVALATLAATLRGPLVRPVARGPGQWLILKPQEAFRVGPTSGHWLDIGTGSGCATALATGALILGAALLAKRFDAAGHWLVALDAAPFAALFATGRAPQLPPDCGRSGAAWLDGLFRSLKGIEAVRVALWGRLACAPSAGRVAGASPDDLRLLILPRAAMPGVVGIECGLAWSSTPVGWAGTPEVLARVLDGTAAAAKLTRAMSQARPVPGRRPDERVVRLLPRVSTRAGTVALVRALAVLLADRRVAVPARAWNAAERRTASRTTPEVEAAA